MRIRLLLSAISITLGLAVAVPCMGQDTVTTSQEPEIEVKLSEVHGDSVGRWAKSSVFLKRQMELT